MTMAVPVSWHIGSTMPEAMLAFFSSSSATKRSLAEASGVITSYSIHYTKLYEPAQIELYATEGDAYKFQFVAKGGGSANKSFLFQATPATLQPDKLVGFLDEKIRTLGTAACPPYHLAVVIGGTSAEMTLKTVSYNFV